MESYVVFPSCFVNPLILGFVEEGSSCATHFVAFSQDFSLLSKVFFQSHLHHPVVWRRNNFRVQHLRRMLSPQWALLVHPSGFWDGSSPWLSIVVWKESQLLCWLNQCYVLLKKWTAADNLMRSTKIVNLFLSGKNGWIIFCPSRQLLVLMIHTKCVQTRELRYILPRNLSNTMTFSVVQGKRILIQTRQARGSSSLIGFSVVDCLRWLGRRLGFWNLHPSLGWPASQERVVSMLVRKHHSAFCLLQQRYLSILTWCWLRLLLLRVCRMDWAFQPSWECNFCNNLRNPGSAAKNFLIWWIPICLKNFESWEFVVIIPWMNWFCLGIQLGWLRRSTFQLSVSIMLGECTGRLPDCSG